jgi:hypothetical protein
LEVFMRPSFLRSLLLAAAPIAIAMTACGDDTADDGGSSGVVELAFERETELLPGFAFDTGLQPPNQPVQASFALSAKGNVTVSAKAGISGSAKSPVLTGLPGTGRIVIDGGFAMVGNLKVDPGALLPVDPYDGPIPGLDNVEIAVGGELEFDPFSIGETVTAVAEIPPTELPGIPLPSPIPGELILTIGEGSVVEIGFTGGNVCAGDDEAGFDGVMVRGGQLVIEPRIAIKAGVFEQDFPITPFTVDLALGENDMSMRTEVKSFGTAPSDGDAIEASSCDPGAGEGGGDQGAGGAGGDPSGSPSSSSTGDTTSSTGDTSSSSTGTGAGGGGDGGGGGGAGGSGPEPEYYASLFIDGVEATPTGVTASFEDTLISEDFTVIDAIDFSYPGGFEPQVWLSAPLGVNGNGCEDEAFLGIIMLNGGSGDFLGSEADDPNCGLVITTRTDTQWVGYYSGQVTGPDDAVHDVEFDFDFYVP